MSAEGGPPDAPARLYARDDDRVIRLKRQRLTGIEAPEIIPGSKPGQRSVRLIRSKDRRFERHGEDTFVATERAIAPQKGIERFFRSLRRVVVGTPISSEHLEEQRLTKVKALAVFSSDALSSSAYATDEVLIALAAAGTAAFTYSLPLAGAIAMLLAIVAISYRQTIKAYPNGGGAYIVAHENLGQTAGLVAAAALAVDYVLTVAVSIAAGVLAITSAFPSLFEFRIEMAILFILLITVANLRGVKESGTIFAIPTYGFIISFVLLIVVGFAKAIADPGLKAAVPASAYEPGASILTAFLILRAFASGCTALTGIEAISNGIPAFQKPESRNASITLTWMAAILTFLFLGITVLAHMLDVHPASEISVPAQIGQAVFGKGAIFFAIQAFTALILILAANTSFADFPRLASILARDRFLPHQFTFRGDRLAFSNGIIVLGFAASILVVAFQADVTKLIPLYAFGVFVSFTLSQSGMVRHWLHNREPGWRGSIIVNASGAVTTAVVAGIVGGTKFSHGAWISMLVMAILGLLFWSISRHYSRVDRRLRVPEGTILAPGRAYAQSLIVPVESVNLAVLKTIEYARSLTRSVTAIHVTDDIDEGRRLRAEWESKVIDVPLVLIDSPYRSFVAPVVSYIDALQENDPERAVSVVLPEYRTATPGTGWLHNQSARRLKKALLDRPNTSVIEIPYDLSRDA
jgi:amino acid transporter